MSPNSSKIARIFCGASFLLMAAVSTSSLRAQAVEGLDAIRLAGGFNSPLFLTAPPGDTSRLFVVQQSGEIRIIDLISQTVKPIPFLDLSGVVSVSGEEGLLGLAFDPNYATNGRFYVYYVAPGGSFGQGVSHVALFRVSSDPDIANAASERTLLTFDQPQTNHNGGWIGFSPRVGDEGNLYIASGDGGNANDQGPGHIEPGGNSQNTTTLLGKMLRIHPNDRPAGSYSIPADNPFVGSDTDRQEIWAFGLRNPFRNSFDRLLGTMFIGDVGQDSREEIDAQPASTPGGGENYGWRVREGFIQNPAYPGDPIPPGAVRPRLRLPAFGRPNGDRRLHLSGQPDQSLARHLRLRGLPRTRVGRLHRSNLHPQFQGHDRPQFPGHHGRLVSHANREFPAA